MSLYGLLAESELSSKVELAIVLVQSLGKYVAESKLLIRSELAPVLLQFLFLGVFWLAPS